MIDFRFTIYDLRLMRKAAGARNVRRGNTIILVIGILVLLVIIGTGYIARTQAARFTSSSITEAGLSNDVVKVVGDQISDEISTSLFVWPILPPTAPPQQGSFPIGTVVDSNSRRLPPPRDAVRYGIDDLFPYNRAPYHTAAVTEWPDFHAPPHHISPVGLNMPALPSIGTDWPTGPGRTNAAAFSSPLIATALLGEGNAVGWPGFGDNRWLRDSEPQRWWTGHPSFPFENGPDAFSHWRHLTNLSRAENGYRIVGDISNVDNNIVWDLRVPVEQWLALRPHSVDPNTGCSNLRWYANGADITNSGTWSSLQTEFINHWQRWFQLGGVDPTSYAQMYALLDTTTNTVASPGNLYHLRDLDCNYSFPVNGQRPQDEFVWGTPRHTVCRVLADTDGDGFTDAFWHLAPVPMENGIRTLVAMSIIDNGGMINMTTATASRRTVDTMKTIGFTPADIALTGWPAFNSTDYKHNVGFLDADANQYPSADGAGFHPPLNYAISAWIRHCEEVGLHGINPTTGQFGPITQTPNQFERLSYWRRAGSRPLSIDPTSPYMPFSFADEIELRMHHGNNTPWIYSRLEHATGEFLHTQTNKEENNELLGQRYNRELLVDLRRMMTTYNSVRNDIMPPWLWLFTASVPRLPGDIAFGDLNGNNRVGAEDDTFVVPPALSDRELFRLGTLKFDLRLPHLTGVNNVLGDFDDDGIFTAAEANNWNVGVAIRDRLERALMDSEDAVARNTYYGPGAAGINLTRELCAAYAANIVQRCDKNNQTNQTGTDLSTALIDAVPVRGLPDTRYMGMVKQPFLVEAFIGHIYKGTLVPAANDAGTPYLNEGHYVLRGDSAPEDYSTVIAVQIANPFDRPIDLNQYRISVFGQDYVIDIPNTPGSSSWLPPSTHDRPVTAVFYAIGDAVGPAANPTPIHDKWKDFFDLSVPPTVTAPTPEIYDLPFGSIVHRVSGTTWDVASRAKYDNNPPANPPVMAVELARNEGTLAVPIWVVIDRMDSPDQTQDFKVAVEAMGTPANKPPDIADPPNTYAIQPPGGLYGELEPDQVFDLQGELAPAEDDFWVQWVRATRAWGVDVDGNGTYDPNERNPRYVFAHKAVVQSRLHSMNTIFSGNSYDDDDEPDPDFASTDPTLSGWFNAGYNTRNLSGNAVIRRKPTFFDMNRQSDPSDIDPSDPNDLIQPIARSFPDKGWYGQGAGPHSPVLVNGQPTYRFPFPMQMLQKDDDFEQVGELLNVWLYGHSIEGTPYALTSRTFSEHMVREALVGNPQNTNRINKLMVGGASSTSMNPVIGRGQSGLSGETPANYTDINHGHVRLPAGARVLDAFVCDGPGRRATNLDDGPRLAKGFDGSGTPGMPNLNTAPPEVLRALPHWLRIVHETGRRRAFNLATGAEPNAEIASPGPLFTALTYSGERVQEMLDGGAAYQRAPRLMLPEALVQYREKYNGHWPANLPWPTALPAPSTPPQPRTGFIFGPNYQNRAATVSNQSGVRSERGIASIGELGLLVVGGRAPAAVADGAGHFNIPNDSNNLEPDPNSGPYGHDRIFNQQWRIDLGVMPATTAELLNVAAANAIKEKPIWAIDGYSPSKVQVPLRLSTDRVAAFSPWSATGAPIAPGEQEWRPHAVAGDVEEANLLLAGASNLVTTRSDTFTVYFKIRRFRQNTSVNPPVWDATNPEYIVEDSRYVMLVDRTNVNKPSDKPRILYLEKLPN